MIVKCIVVGLINKEIMIILLISLSYSIQNPLLRTLVLFVQYNYSFIYSQFGFICLTKLINLIIYYLMRPIFIFFKSLWKNPYNSLKLKICSHVPTNDCMAFMWFYNTCKTSMRVNTNYKSVVLSKNIYKSNKTIT